MQYFILYALLIAIAAVIYRRFLSREEILSWWFQFGDRNFSGKWFYKPIWGCEFCIAGQMALWTYILNALSVVIREEHREITGFILSLVPLLPAGEISVFGGVIFVCLTIFFVGIVNFIYTKIFD